MSWAAPMNATATWCLTASAHRCRPARRAARVGANARLRADGTKPAASASVRSADVRPPSGRSRAAPPRCPAPVDETPAAARRLGRNSQRACHRGRQTLQPRRQRGHGLHLGSKCVRFARRRRPRPVPMGLALSARSPFSPSTERSHRKRHDGRRAEFGRRFSDQRPCARWPGMPTASATGRQFARRASCSDARTSLRPMLATVAACSPPRPSKRTSGEPGWSRSTRTWRAVLGGRRTCTGTQRRVDEVRGHDEVDGMCRCCRHGRGDGRNGCGRCYLRGSSRLCMQSQISVEADPRTFQRGKRPTNRLQSEAQVRHDAEPTRRRGVAAPGSIRLQWPATAPLELAFLLNHVLREAGDWAEAHAMLNCCALRAADATSGLWHGPPEAATGLAETTASVWRATINAISNGYWRKAWNPVTEVISTHTGQCYAASGLPATEAAAADRRAALRGVRCQNGSTGFMVRLIAIACVANIAPPAFRSNA